MPSFAKLWRHNGLFVRLAEFAQTVSPSCHAMNTAPRNISLANPLFDAGETQRPPHVSIVVTNHNYGRFLRQCLESALDQDHPSLEVVVVDDGSTDNSREIISAFCSLRAEVKVVLRENGGQAAAMNSGFAVATGDWILFLDSDDVLDRQAIAAAIGAAEENTSTIQFYLRTIDSRGQGIGLHPFCHVLEGGDLFGQICASGHFRFMPTSGNLFRRRALERICPIPERQWTICADTYLAFAVALQGRVTIVPQFLGSYRIHDMNRWYEDGQSESKLRQIIRNHLVVWAQLLHILKRPSFAANDYARLSLIRRICLSLHLYRKELPLPDPDVAGLKGKLFLALLGTDVALREKFLHLAILALAGGGSRAARSVFRALLTRQARNSPWSRLIGWFETAGRYDWLGNGVQAAGEIPDLPVERRVDFGHGGEGRRFHRYGFGETENWRSWATAQRAGLAFRLPPDLSRVTLDIELTAYTCEPHVKAQSLQVTIGARPVFTSQIKDRVKVSLDIADHVADRDRIVSIDFLLPDAVVPALVDERSSATRWTSIALVSMTARLPTPEPKERHPAITLGSRLTAATGSLQELADDGWEIDRGSIRLRRRAGHLRFSMPNPVMDRFAIRLGFLPAPAEAKGDWRVTVALPNVGADCIDLRETSVAILVVPRGSGPKDGLFNLAVSANSILPLVAGEEHLPGPRLCSLTLQPFDAGIGRLSLWRSDQVLDFTVAGTGKQFLTAGWHQPDEYGSWSMDTLAILGGYYFEDPAEIFLTIRLSSWQAEGAPQRQLVKIRANGKTIVERGLLGTEDILAIIPSDAIGSDRYLKIEIGCAFIGSPHSFDGSGDQRHLGVRLEKLVVAPLPVD